MWCTENGSGAELLLAVSRRISVGLEEGDREAADKTGCKAGISGHPEKAFQEREAGGLPGREKAQPLFLLLFEQGKPVVELVLGNTEVCAYFFYGSRPKEIFRQDTEDKEKAVGGIRDDEIRKDGMGMAAGTDKAQDTEAVPDRLSANEISQGTFIIGMDGTGSLCPTTGAGLSFRPETVHEGVKKFF